MVSPTCLSQSDLPADFQKLILWQIEAVRRSHSVAIHQCRREPVANLADRGLFNAGTTSSWEAK